jgi:hypothetical protein
MRPYVYSLLANVGGTQFRKLTNFTRARRKRKQRIDGAALAVRGMVPALLRPLLEPIRRRSVIAEVVMRHMASGAILDFGAGHCIKPALLALSGYKVSACDDLADPWHMCDPTNRQIVMDFAKRAQVDFFLISPGL